MTTIRRFFAYTLYVLCIPSLILAQGQFLKRGESGCGITSSAAVARNSSGYDIAIGYSYKGVLDLGLGVGRSYAAGSFNGKTYGNFVAPQLTIFLQKSDTLRKSASIAFSMSYQFITFKQPVFVYTYGFSQASEETKTTYTSAKSISFAFIKNLSVKKNPMTQIAFSVQGTQAETRTQIGIFAGLSLASRTQQGTIMALTPSVGYVFISKEKFLAGGVELTFVF